MYVNILRRVPRPRGLGGIARAASGMGTWVVDRPWGLSPAIIPGQPQPYQGMVRTMLPRSQHPRLLNASYRVVAGGSWPRLLPANSPVFRTPVTAPGAQAVNETLPGTPVPAGASGYGWVPLGVAHPPFRLVGSGMSGYGQDAGSPLDSVPANLRVSPEDQQWLADHPDISKKIIHASASIYAALRAMRDRYIVLRTTLTYSEALRNNRGVAGAASQIADAQATQIVFGTPGGSANDAAKRRGEVLTQIQRYEAASGSIGTLAAQAQYQSGAITVLTSTGAFSTQDMKTGPTPTGFAPTLSGLGFDPATWLIIGGIAAVALIAGGTYAYVSVQSGWQEIEEQKIVVEAEERRSTSAYREAALASMKVMLAQLERETDPARQQQLRENIASAQGMYEAAGGAMKKDKQYLGDWSNWLIAGAFAVGFWWILGKPGLAGMRRRAGEAATTMRRGPVPQSFIP